MPSFNVLKNFQILPATQPPLLCTSLYQWLWMWHKDNVPFIQNVLFFLWEDLCPLDITEEMIQVVKHKCLLPLQIPYSVQNILSKGKHKGPCKQQQLEVKWDTLTHINWYRHLYLDFWPAHFGYSGMLVSYTQCVSQDSYLSMVFSLSLYPLFLSTSD